MKLFLTISLGLVVLLQAASTSLIVLNYQVNMDYIIENFCENTDKPEMHCNGKCHLKKQIAEDEKQKSDNPISVNEGMTFVLAVEELPTVNLKSGIYLQAVMNSNYLLKNYGSHLYGIFHPPQV